MSEKEVLCNKLLSKIETLEEERRQIEIRIGDLREVYLDVVNGWTEPDEDGDNANA